MREWRETAASETFVESFDSLRALFLKQNDDSHLALLWLEARVAQCQQESIKAEQGWGHD